MGRVIEVVIDLETVDPQMAVLPSERVGPTCFDITPIERPGGGIDFRVKFEPDNKQRRSQPFRHTVHPIFPK